MRWLTILVLVGLLAVPLMADQPPMRLQIYGPIDGTRMGISFDQYLPFRSQSYDDYYWSGSVGGELIPSVASVWLRRLAGSLGYELWISIHHPQADELGQNPAWINFGVVAMRSDADGELQPTEFLLTSGGRNKNGRLIQPDILGDPDYAGVITGGVDIPVYEIDGDANGWRWVDNGHALEPFSQWAFYFEGMAWPNESFMRPMRARVIFNPLANGGESTPDEAAGGLLDALKAAALGAGESEVKGLFVLFAWATQGHFVPTETELLDHLDAIMTEIYGSAAWDSPAIGSGHPNEPEKPFNPLKWLEKAEGTYTMGAVKSVIDAWVSYRDVKLSGPITFFRWCGTFLFAWFAVSRCIGSLMWGLGISSGRGVIMKALGLAGTKKDIEPERDETASSDIAKRQQEYRDELSWEGGSGV